MAKKLIDPFSAHEAMDRTHLITTMFGDFVVQHTFIQANPKLRREVEEVADALGELYQSVGRAAFEIHHNDASPEALARELGVSPKTLRAFLRKTYPRSSGEHHSHWHLTNEQIAFVRKHYPTRSK